MHFWQCIFQTCTWLGYHVQFCLKLRVNSFWQVDPNFCSLLCIGNIAGNVKAIIWCDCLKCHKSEELLFNSACQPTFHTILKPDLPALSTLSYNSQCCLLQFVDPLPPSWLSELFSGERKLNKLTFVHFSQLTIFKGPFFQSDIKGTKGKPSEEKKHIWFGQPDPPWPEHRVDIWRDRCDRRSCKIFARCVNFSENSAINLIL